VKDLDIEFALSMAVIFFVVVSFFGFIGGAVYYTEHTKAECIKQSLENKLTVTEIQVLCGK